MINFYNFLNFRVLSTSGAGTGLKNSLFFPWFSHRQCFLQSKKVSMVTFNLLNQSRTSKNFRMIEAAVSVPSKEICSCYCMVSSTIWEILSEFSIFCNLFHKLLCEWNNTKTWETRKIFANIGKYCLPKSNVARVT